MFLIGRSTVYFDLIRWKLQPFSRSKFSFSRSAVRLQPFETFLKPFSRTTSTVRNFPLAVQPFDFNRSNFSFSRSAVQPFDFNRSKFFWSRSAVHGIRFKRFLYPFVIRSHTVRSTVRTDTVRNVFAWEGTIVKANSMITCSVEVERLKLISYLLTRNLKFVIIS